MSYSSVVLADAPIAYARLGESSGTTMVDSSGNGRDGIYQGSPGIGSTGLLTGDADKGLGLTANAAADYGGLWANAAWMNVTAITVECLVNLTSAFDASAGDGLVTRYDGANASRWLLWRNGSGQLAVRVRNNSNQAYNIAAASAASLNTTYHLAFTLSGNELKLYINGAQEGSTLAFGGVLGAPNVPIAIGQYQGLASTVPGGTIDEVAIYDYALSATQIAAHYDAATKYMASLAMQGLAPTVAISASYSTPLSLSMESPLGVADFSATYSDPVSATLDLTAPAVTGALTASYDPAPIECALAGTLPLPTLGLSTSRRVFIPPTTLEYGDDNFFGRFGIPVGQSVVLTDGHYVTTPYPWLGEIADLKEGVEWFQGGRRYQINSATAAALLADGYTLTEV